MQYNFDLIPDRRATESIKWRLFDADMLPLWVADMDFPSPQPVIDALRQRVEHGIFGYPGENDELREVLVDRLAVRYGWHVPAEAFVFVPGVINGFNLACQAVTQPGQAVLMQVPVYFPFFSAPKNAGLTQQNNVLVRQADGRYAIDFDAFEAAITKQTRFFLLCNPHNPVGRVFRRDELERMAQICLRHGLTICSDEIHCDLVYAGYQHLPIASLDAEVEKNTITLMAPSKTYNIAGLNCSFAVIPNPELRQRFTAACKGLIGSVNLLGQIAALAAYRDGQEWLDQLLVYLQGNRDFMADYIQRELPMLKMTPVEGTYLAWLDCRNADLGKNPTQTLMKQARVVFNDGDMFGPGGEGFVRVNFGCPRPLLQQALERVRRVLVGG